MNTFFTADTHFILERLTIDEIIENCKRTTKIYEKLNGNKLETADISFAPVKEYWEHRQVKEYLEELKRYRDLDEQDLLLRLPCKVGDTVYAIGFNNNKPIIYESVVLNILIAEKEIVFNVKVDELETNSQLKQSMFGKTVFLTKAEAEQKIEQKLKDGE